MKIKILSALFCCLLTIPSINGQKPAKKDNEQANITPLQTQLMDERVSDLMADRVGLKTSLATEVLATIEYISHDDLVEAESLMYPADELYGSWDTLRVNSFRTKGNEIEFPDSFQVDCQSFVIPIDIPIKVTSNYGPRRRRMHKGIDLKVEKGDTIRAAFDGKVRIKGYERRGYGYYLVLRHPNGLETIYGHLSKFLVAENDILRAGTPIGLGGNTGRSTGSHLHFETRFLGQALNPNDIIDFETGTPHNDYYVMYKKRFDKVGNIYTSTSERIVYHRIKTGETLSQIALMYHTSVAELCRLNGLTRTSKLRIGQTLRCGTTIDKTKKDSSNDNQVATTGETETKSSAEIAAPASKSLYHEVQPKETLSSIARIYNTTVDALCKINNIYATSKISVGQRICYRLVKTETKTVSTQDEATDSQTMTATNSAEQLDEPTEKITETKVVKESVYYRVKKGDTLSSIAREHGLSVSQLCKMNNITTTTTLQIGHALRCS
jgi:murein DD-endopeptidase MepM/ murein hydrolase activator NlpD